jgi:hypothetical protein
MGIGSLSLNGSTWFTGLGRARCTHHTLSGQRPRGPEIDDQLRRIETAKGPSFDAEAPDQSDSFCPR